MVRDVALTCVLVVFLANPVCAQNDPVKAAIEFLQIACVNKGHTDKLVLGGSIDASLKGLRSSLIQGKATYTREEIEGLSKQLNEFSSKQASEARQCMQPYIREILAVILKNNISQKEQLGDVDLKSMRAVILSNKEQIAKTLIRTTHPSGRYNDSLHPMFNLSPDKITLETTLTINWRGKFLQHTTIFLIKTEKRGKTDVLVSSDNAVIPIAAENLRTARASVENILKNSFE